MMALLTAIIITVVSAEHWITNAIDSGTQCVPDDTETVDLSIVCCDSEGIGWWRSTPPTTGVTYQEANQVCSGTFRMCTTEEIHMFLDSEINRLMVWTGSSCTVEAANPELRGPATSEPTATPYDIAPNGCEYEVLASGQYCSSYVGFYIRDSLSECFKTAKSDSRCHSEGLQGPIVFYNDVTQNCYCSTDDCFTNRDFHPDYAIYQEPLCHNGCEIEVTADDTYCSSGVGFGVTTLSDCFEIANSDSRCYNEGSLGPIVFYNDVTQNCHCSADDCFTNRGFNPDYAIYQPQCHSELYYAAKGRPNTGCSEENGCDTVAADPSDVYPVRCCSDSAITGWDDQSDREPGVCSNWAAIDIWSDGCEERNWADANDYCNSKNGRLCTLEEMEQGCARSTGCSFDSRLVWTSTSA